MASGPSTTSPGFPRTADLKKHGSIERMWEGQLKLFIAQDNSSGEIFIQPLRAIQQILERAVMVSDSSASGGETATISDPDKNFTYLLVTEKLPQLIAYMPKIKSSKQEMGVLLLDVLCCVMALEQDFLATFPMTFASCLLYCQPSPQWEEASDEIMCRLCYYVLPMCLVHPSVPGSPSHSLGTSSALMMVLEGCTATKHHLLIADTLMQLKRDVCTDILSVIAYGTPNVRQKALNLLLHYWPIPQKLSTSSTYREWPTPSCENTKCRRSITRASVLCLNARCATTHKKGAAKLYMLLCPDCDATIHGSAQSEDHLRLRFSQPIRDVKPNCEFQKICSGKDCQVNKAEVTCYDSSCTAIQNGQPIRMCRDCHNKQHGEMDDHKHIFQVGPPDPWTLDDPAGSSTMLEAISKLLEVVPTVKDPNVRVAAATLRSPTIDPHIQIEIDSSREGMWLLKHYCTPANPVRYSQTLTQLPIACSTVNHTASDGKLGEGLTVLQAMGSWPHQSDWMIHLVALVLDWLHQYYEILRSWWEEGCVGGGAAAFNNCEPPKLLDPEHGKFFSNYAEISELIQNYILPWLDAVCTTNVDCVSETLQPSLRDCAQVGSLWNKSHSTFERQKRSLSLLLLLYQLFREKLLAEETFMRVFHTVMPLWLDLLVQLRTEPGKMEKFQDQLMQLFTSYETHDEGLKIYDFIWEKFRSKNSESRQKALFWLQDLTRLKVPIAYLPHMFEDALKEKRGGTHSAKKHTLVEPTSSFDQEVERSDAMPRMNRRGSSGSLSGYESESALLSQSSFEQPDTQEVVSLNSSLGRFILMLDIWLSQMELKIPTLDYTALQKTVVHMLKRTWGSLHTYPDHRDTSNICLLCRAMALWFSLVRKLIEENTKRKMESEGHDEGTDLGSPTVTRRGSILKIKSLTPTSHKRKKAVSVAEGMEAAVFKSGKKVSGESIEFVDYDGSRSQAGRRSVDILQEIPRLKVDRPRKLAMVQSHSEFEVVSCRGGAAAVTPPSLPPAYKEETQEDAIPPIYKIFQLCTTKLTPKLHPDTLQQIVQCLSCLVRSGKVFELTHLKSTIVSDVNDLCHTLWQCIECETSSMARSCVVLLLDCVHFLTSDTAQTVESSPFWKMLKDGLTTSKWSTKFKTVEKLTAVLQFMLSHESLGTERFSAIQITLAHGFCLLVLLLQDDNSNVYTRTRYCLSSLKASVIDALKNFLVLLFTDHASHRTLILQTLSLLDSTLPELHFVSMELLHKLLMRVTTSTHFKEEAQLRVKEGATIKKISDVSVLSGRATTPKASTIISVSAPLEDNEIVQQIVSLILRYISNPRSDCQESVRKLEKHRKEKRRTIMGRSSVPALSEAPEVLVEILKDSVCRNFHCTPYNLRRSSIFETFLYHIFPALDRNPELSRNKGLIPFVLRLLGYSAAPVQTDFPHMTMDDKQPKWRQCFYTLGSLPPKLQTPWLRVFFVILYKHSHHFSESEPSDQEVLILLRWCLEITLNSLEADSHNCPLLTTADPAHETPVFDSCSTSGPQTPVIEVETVTTKLAPPIHQREGAPLTPVPEDVELLGSHKSAPGGFRKLGRATESGSTISSLASVTDSFKVSSSVNPSVGLCSICGMATNEYSEEVIAQCVVAVGTCSHRMPHTVSSYLVSRIIPVLAKVIVPGSYPWQLPQDSDTPPGSAMAVSKHFLASILAQFADRRLFLYLFGHNLGTKAEVVFASIAESLVKPEGEGEGGEREERKLSPFSPMKYLFQDACALSSAHFTQEVRRYSFINLALYVDTLDSLSPTTPLLMKELPLWDGFCKKLKSHTELLRDTKAVHSFLRVIIALLSAIMKTQAQHSISTYHAHAVQSFMLSLSAVVETALYNVYCPLGGLVQLAGLWYKAFQQHSHRESEKFVKLYIIELRKAFKARSTGESIRADNFLSLIQVLLLEEHGYLGYVDSLTERRLYAPELKYTYETHCLGVIDGMQWDFLDALHFLSSPSHRWPSEMLPQLKLSLAQLVALRVQHGRPPVDRLRKIIRGEIRTLTTANPKSGGGRVTLHPHWQDSLVALHMFTWLMLGSMCHNTIDTAAAALEVKMESGLCQLFRSLDIYMEVNTHGVVALATGALQKLNMTSEPNSGFLYLTFMFTAVWTVYMELYVPDSTVFIIEFWQKFIRQLVELVTSNNTEENYHRDIVHSFNDWVVMRVRRVALASYSLLLPIWREVTKLVSDPTLTFPNLPSPIVVVPVDIWLKDAVKELVLIEVEWQSIDATAQ